MSTHKHTKDTNYPIVGAIPVEVDVHNKSHVANPSIPVTVDTATGTHVDHHDTIDTKKDHIVHKGDKQPTELHEPKAEKNYKLRDDEKDYEFKPRTEFEKTKDGKMKVWEEHGRKDNVVLEHGVNDHAVHVHEHDKHVDDHHEKEGGLKDKLKEKKDQVKDKIKEHKEKKEHKKHHDDHDHKVKEVHHHEEKVVSPGHVEHTKIEEHHHKTEHTSGNPFVSDEHKVKDEENIHVKMNINKT
jgi:hypothetical protein